MHWHFAYLAAYAQGRAARMEMPVEMTVCGSFLAQIRSSEGWVIGFQTMLPLALGWAKGKAWKMPSLGPPPGAGMWLRVSA